MKRPLIFITNDDGYRAKGIASLVEAVRELGDVVVVAPDGPRSGMSSAITSIQPLRYFKYKEEEGLTVYVCTGTPADCVKIGIGEILKDRKPDLVVTGINHGSNAAISVLYSGTMGAAFEGCLFGVDSIGFSLLDHSANADFTPSLKVVKAISEQVLANGLPSGTCLNVNIPKGDAIKGIRVGRQTKGKWIKEYNQSTDGAGHPVYWLTGEFDNLEVDQKDTDEYILKENYVSVVPVKVDMTDHEYMKNLKSLEDLI